MNRLLLSLLICAGTAFGQASFTLPGVTAGEPSLTVTVSATGVSNLTAWVQTALPNSGWPNAAGQPAATTLSGAINATATTLTLGSTTNLQTCNGLLIDSEVIPVVSVSGNQVTVLRNFTSTIPASHSAGAPVTPLRFGNYTCMVKGLIADGIGNVVQSKLQGAALETQTAAIVAANAAIATAVAGAVQ